ncbi:MAG TPA: hypothetical protein VK694_00920 [Verrucomicrobiae bacterium]|nr:hypothetical protein [Verrucomicrobiae bacterium]
MSFRHYSAEPMFGAPIDDPEVIASVARLENLMQSYDIEPQALPVGEAVNLTPPYFIKPSLRCSALLAHPEGPVIIEFVVAPGMASARLRSAAQGVEITTGASSRFEIPTDYQFVPIAGPSPRFAGPCLHHLILYED